MRFTNRYSNGKAFIMNCALQTTNGIEDAIEKLAYYEDLEEQGRLVTLPCKVGDSFFTFARVCLCPEDENGCDMYERCSICPYNWYEVAEWKFKSVINILNSEPNFGKTMFLTREEAEAKVAKINSETRIKR
jgi:hypothetical protein